jgi:hypothetical protein
VILTYLLLGLEVHVLGVLLVSLDPGLQHVDEELLAVQIVGCQRGGGLLLDRLQLGLFKKIMINNLCKKLRFGSQLRDFFSKLCSYQFGGAGAKGLKSKCLPEPKLRIAAPAPFYLSQT